jgi:histidinol-phosphate aminotransferase
VFEALHAAITADNLRKYPQPSGETFRRAAARVLQVDPESILIGNGSDDILTILTRTFVPEGGLITSPSPSYILYRSLAEIQGARFQMVPFTTDWQLPDPWPYPDANLTFVPNPNSPSGTMIRRGELERLAASLTGPLVLDEAYGDFAEWNGLDLARNRKVILTRSFSKYYALAGIRFGFAVADPAIIRELNKVKDSYNCDVLSLAAATAAMEDQAYYADCRARIVATRGRLSAALTRLGFRVTPSEANFVWCRREAPMKPLADALKARGILIRYMNYPGSGDGLRITVGTDAETDRLLSELESLV